VNKQRVIFVSNGGPDRLVGGVVSLIKPLAKRFKAIWISASNGAMNQDVYEDKEVTVKKVALPSGVYRSYYDGFCNEGLWTLCHHQTEEPLFTSKDFDSYVVANHLFAQEVVRCASDLAEPIIFINDYQLALLPKLIRSALPRAKILFYWHIPWPLYSRLKVCPWNSELINGILGADNIGFQTNQDRSNFISSIPEDLRSGSVANLGVYPASIEWPVLKNLQQLSVTGNQSEITQKYQLQKTDYIFLSVDRVDYAKGIIERLNVIKKILELNPSIVKKIKFIQIYIQTRPSILKYKQYEEQITELIAKINNEYGSKDWQPIISEQSALTKKQLTFLYRSANCLWVSSLADGQNLICKEFIAARDDEDGALMLSMHAGAAKDLPSAVIYDPLSEKDAIQAFNQILSMGSYERKKRMISLRRSVKNYDVHLWMDEQLSSLYQEA
jgi:trehalose 6-phosphate synthase